MDILSHGFWAGAAYKAMKIKTRKPLDIKKAVIFGALPDILSFAPLFFWIFYQMAVGGMGISDLPSPEKGEPPPEDASPIFYLTRILYNLTHSAVVFPILFLLIFLIFRRPMWEAGAWFFHILIDIPTHSYKFYPTPFLWPVSDFKFSGISWGTPWFLAVNLLLIIAASVVYCKNSERCLQFLVGYFLS